MKSSRSWCITQSAEKITLEELKLALADYTYIAQLEQGEKGGEQGYRHYQIYIENSTPIRFETLKNKLPNAHLEKRRGSKKEAFDYCTKTETRIGEPFGNGQIDLVEKQGQRKDIEEIRNAILLDDKKPSDVILENPNACRFVKYIDRLQAEKLNAVWSCTPRLNIKIHYWYGETGTGKTRGVFDKHGYKDVFRVTDYKHPFDNYNYQRVIVLDEYRSQLPISYLLNLTDIYPLELNCRFQNKWACFTEVYIISNIAFEKQYKIEQLEEPQTVKALKRRLTDIKYFNGVTIVDMLDREQIKFNELVLMEDKKVF